MKPWKAKEIIEGNPIGLPQEVTLKLVPKLDRHQASLFLLFHQYQKHHWLVEGPQFRDLHLFLQEAYEAVHKQVDHIAERITALGGIPTSHPAALVKAAYVEHEPEGTFRIRAMLQLDRSHEGQIAQKLRETIAEARESGDPGTEHLLKEVLLGVEDRAHHLDHFLGGDSLELGLEA
ncbi:MAG: ferritin-like domain-containing protein [Vicinamibacteria bacterium]